MNLNKENIISDLYPPRRNSGEEFEYYVERIFSTYIVKNFINIENKLTEINERLNKMATLAEELGVDEKTLSEVIPALATELTNLQTTISEKETALKTAIETEQHTEVTLAEKNAELSAIQQVKENLTPLVEKAKGLVPASPTATPAETSPVTEQPVAETANPTPASPSV